MAEVLAVEVEILESDGDGLFKLTLFAVDNGKILCNDDDDFTFTESVLCGDQVDWLEALWCCDLLIDVSATCVGGKKTDVPLSSDMDVGAVSILLCAVKALKAVFSIVSGWKSTVEVASSGKTEAEPRWDSGVSDVDVLLLAVMAVCPAAWSSAVEVGRGKTEPEPDRDVDVAGVEVLLLAVMVACPSACSRSVEEGSSKPEAESDRDVDVGDIGVLLLAAKAVCPSAWSRAAEAGRDTWVGDAAPCKDVDVAAVAVLLTCEIDPAWVVDFMPKADDVVLATSMVWPSEAASEANTTIVNRGNVCCWEVASFFDGWFSKVTFGDVRTVFMGSLKVSVVSLAWYVDRWDQEVENSVSASFTAGVASLPWPGIIADAEWVCCVNVELTPVVALALCPTDADLLNAVWLVCALPASESEFGLLVDGLSSFNWLVGPNSVWNDDAPSEPVCSCAEEVHDKMSGWETVLVSSGVLLAVSASVEEDEPISEYDDDTPLISCDDELSKNSSYCEVALVENAKSLLSDKLSLGIIGAESLEGGHSHKRGFANLAWSFKIAVSE
jgi:hypothetical protein